MNSVSNDCWELVHDSQNDASYPDLPQLQKFAFHYKASFDHLIPLTAFLKAILE